MKSRDRDMAMKFEDNSALQEKQSKTQNKRHKQ